MMHLHDVLDRNVVIGITPVRPACPEVAGRLGIGKVPDLACLGVDDDPVDVAHQVRIVGVP